MRDNGVEDKYYINGEYSLDELIRIIRDIMLKTKVKGSKVKSLTIDLTEK